MAKHIIFPHQTNQWPGVKSILKGVLTSPPFSGKELIDRLKPVLHILHQDVVDVTVFNGLKNYLKEAPWQKRETYFSKCFPTLIQYALDIEKNSPQHGLTFAVQNFESKTVIERKLAASIVACSFLCLWPGRKYDSRSLLNGINFFEFFRTCGTDPGQAGKLECILHYFEALADEGEPVGDIVFHRQMLSKAEVLTIQQWEKSVIPLCPCEVHLTGRIEDAGPKVLQVDFANRKIGGGVLGKGKVQEEIRFTISPELISGLLFMEAMTEHEAIVVQGFKNYSDYTGYRGSFTYTGPFPDTAQMDCHGNLENYLVAIDALSFKNRLGGPGAQYHLEEPKVGPPTNGLLTNLNIMKIYSCWGNWLQHLQREMNKAFIGFRQDFLDGTLDPLQGEYTPTNPTEDRHMQGIVETYFSSLSESILTKALQESLVSLKDEASQSPSPVTSHSSGQNGRTLPEHPDIVGATLGFARRRSSNLSDSSSRRSSSTTGSRRSSGNQLTSSECSELEEYYQAHQARHSLKPSVIKEEIGDSAENTSDVQELADQVIQSIFNPTVHTQEVCAEPEVKTFSKEQPKTPIVKPKAQMLANKSGDFGGPASRWTKNPDKQRNHPQKELPSKQEKSRLHHKSENIASFDSVDSVEETLPFSQQESSLKKEPHVEFKSSHLTFRPPQGKSQKASESPLISSSSSSENQRERVHYVQRQVESPQPVPDHLYSYSGYLSDYIMDHAWREIYEIYVGERYRSDSYSSSKHSERGQVEGYIGGIVESVWNYSAYNIRKHYKTKQEQQQMWTSDSDIDLDLDLYIYADDFVQGVLTDAVGIYKSQKKEELKRVEAMWQKAQEKFETDAKYFDAEFTRYWKEVQSRQSQVYQRSRIQLEMQRRRSLDETGRGYRHSSAKFRDPTLSNFELQLLKSAGEEKLLQQSMSSFERELLSVDNALGNNFAPYSALRRASEPVTTRRASFDVAHLYPSDTRRGSSVCSTSSREMILDWLNQSQRSSSSSGNGHQRRTRTTSSHLDWYAQDLLLEAFNDALKDLFGDIHSAMVGSGVTGRAEVDSINNSFSSSQSNDQICDTYIAIPTSAPAGSSCSFGTGVGSQYSQSKVKHSTKNKETCAEGISDSDGMFSCEHVRLNSSSPIESPRSNRAKLEAIQQVKGTKSKQCYSDSNIRSDPVDVKSNSQQGKEQKVTVMSSDTSLLASGVKSKKGDAGSSQPHERTNSKVDQNLDQSTSLSQSFQPLAERHPVVSSAAAGTGTSLRRRDQGRENVESMVDHMMEGMCENLSNEVLEGAVHTLNSQQATEGRPTQTASVGCVMPVATGNWGCGAYRGDAQLKAMIQWMSASQRGTPLYMYYTFGDRAVDRLGYIVRLVQGAGLSVGALMSLVRTYCDLRDSNQTMNLTLFEYIEKELSNKPS